MWEQSRRMFLELHAAVHESSNPGSRPVTYEDEVWQDLDEITARTAVNGKGRTVLYGMWHSARIEDMTMNVLVDGKNEIFDREDWRGRMGVSLRDTGNSLIPDQILTFSHDMDIASLRAYRTAVAERTREIISRLSCPDMKRKVRPEGLKRLLADGSVLDTEGSRWLIDFWGKKNTAGILLMPCTRHHMVHINESLAARKNRKK